MRKMISIAGILLQRMLQATFLMAMLSILAGCGWGGGGSGGEVLFKVLDPAVTGLEFQNTLHPTRGFNVFDYMYFYNGGGIGAGDFNNDGLIDLFFSANQGNNKLYLNTGGLHFKDITDSAGIPEDSGWSTGVSVVDINNDGLLDIYICRVGKLAGLPVRHNQLLICREIGKNGIPRYADSAHEYGLDFSGFSTQAVFFDYDGDGDLDMYLLNHSIHQNGTFGPRQEKLASFNPLSGDRLFRNDGDARFTDVTRLAGIHSSVIGYGLGIAVSDIDLDGYPDIYVGNDFHENDYLYINHRDGTFRDELADRMMHTSQYSMGVDIADVNNDGYPEIISVDMLPYDPYLLKRSEGEDTWDIFNMKIGYGYGYQYTRNNLQLNRRNGHFSEVGLYSGVAATDWSWSPLWVDFDNDGLKDLFVSNGIPKRLNDIDYIDFVSDAEMQQKMRDNKLEDKDLDMINRFPEIKLPSKFFKNEGEMAFSDQAPRIEGSRPAYSNGAIYADLDNDGDPDLVANAIDGPALLYENKTNDKADKAAAGEGAMYRKRPGWVDLSLRGSDKNRNAIGAKAVLFAKDGIRVYEKFPVRGFLSSMEEPIHIGLNKMEADSLVLVWPDNTCQRILLPQGRILAEEPLESGSRLAVPAAAEGSVPGGAGIEKLPSRGSTIRLTWRPGLPAFDYSVIGSYHKNPSRPMEDITRATGLLYRHTENRFHEFDREPLIPHMLSTEGPALAVADINGDGLEDVYIGASKWEKSVVFLQDRSGRFTRVVQPALDLDSTYEDVGACWTDVDGDGYPDLVIASGGNEFYGKDPFLSPRVYLNDGRGRLKKKPDAFDTLYVNASCVVPFDFNGDGAMDLFIGGRSVPFDYGSVPRSYLLQNDGKGRFTDVTVTYARGLSGAGFVTGAVWEDLDGDGGKDLVVSLEWGGIMAFMHNHENKYIQKALTDRKGWWSFLLPVDIDGDGDIDLVAGNLGLNSRLHASEKEPVRLYHYDFDDNGRKEQIMTYYLGGREIPFANKAELQRQLPGLKKSFLYAEDFARASLKDLFPGDKLGKADILDADYFPNALLLNDGHGSFTVRALPWEAQLSSYRDAIVVDANGDSLPDILLTGNYYDNNIEMGRYDGDYGSILLNRGHDSLEAVALNGLAVKGQVRHIRRLPVGGREAFLLAKNNDSVQILRFAR